VKVGAVEGTKGAAETAVRRREGGRRLVGRASVTAGGAAGGGAGAACAGANEKAGAVAARGVALVEDGKADAGAGGGTTEAAAATGALAAGSENEGTNDGAVALRPLCGAVELDAGPSAGLSNVVGRGDAAAGRGAKLNAGTAPERVGAARGAGAGAGAKAEAGRGATAGAAAGGRAGREGPGAGATTGAAPAALPSMTSWYDEAPRLASTRRSETCGLSVVAARRKASISNLLAEPAAARGAGQSESGTTHL